MKLRTYNPTMAKLYGKKPSAVDKMIMKRSELVHTELQFGERYGYISFSSTRTDGCKCARFKMIGYSHPERWMTVDIPVTDEQEDMIYVKCLEMADWDCTINSDANRFVKYLKKEGNGCFYGPNALKYDTPAVLFSFITEWDLWRGSKKKAFCTEACFIALLMAFPDILEFGESNYVTATVEYTSGTGEQKITTSNYLTKLRPDQLTPSLGHYIASNYFRKD